MKKRHHGEIRRSQLVRTFGPGAMVDLPNHSVVVSGLEAWFPASEMPAIVEERLSLKVATVLGHAKPVPLKGPPVVADDERMPATGVPAFQFPEWFVVQASAKRRPLVHLDSLEKGKYVVDGRKCPAIPVRFVQACVLGHLSDIDWRGFIHMYRGDCARPIRMEERGSSGDLADVIVGCDCGAERSMAQATRRGAENLGVCLGKRPWLGRHGGEKCGGAGGKLQLARLLVRSASDAYFAQVLSVISLPDRGTLVRDAVAKLWENFLAFVEEQGELAKERRKPAVKAALEGLADEEVWAEIERRKSGAPAKAEKIKEVELATLLSVKEKLGDDFHGGREFLARRIPVKAASGPTGSSGGRAPRSTVRPSGPSNRNRPAPRSTRNQPPGAGLPAIRQGPSSRNSMAGCPSTRPTRRMGSRSGAGSPGGGLLRARGRVRRSGCDPGGSGPRSFRHSARRVVSFRDRLPARAGCSRMASAPGRCASDARGSRVAHRGRRVRGPACGRPGSVRKRLQLLGAVRNPILRAR